MDYRLATHVVLSTHVVLTSLIASVFYLNHGPFI